jgi:hypothetical protein
MVPSASLCEGPYRDGLGSKYARARELGYEALADELFAIADDKSFICERPDIANAVIQQQRLAVDTRKWFLSKVLPHRFGDRVEIVGNADAPLVTKIELVAVYPRHQLEPPPIDVTGNMTGDTTTNNIEASASNGSS